MNPLDEIYDVVDKDDNIIGKATRREIHEKSLLHRAVHILVFNPAGELYLQKRAMSKDENPGLWDTSSAGHVDSGEDYLTSARRELKEELGIEENLQPFIKIKAGPKTAWEHVTAYTCTTRKQIFPDPVEISEGRFWSLEEVLSGLEKDGEKFTSTFKTLFNRYLKTR